MKSKITICSTLVLLLSLHCTSLAAPPPPANPLIGAWFAIDPNDGSHGFLAVNGKLDFIFFDTDAQGGCFPIGGGPFLGTAKLDDVIEGTLRGTVFGLCQGGKSKIDFFIVLRYVPETDEMTARGGTFRRINNVDPEKVVGGATELKTMNIDGWEFLNLVLQGIPVFAPPPGAGADCTDPPNLVPGADLTNCKLEGTDLTGIDLTGANLSGADLSFADLLAAILTGVDLTGANLSNASLAFADLTDANLSGASLVAASFAFTNLTGVDLTGANLSVADLSQTDLSVGGITWSNTICPDFTNSDDPDGDGFTCLNNL